ncbi:PaaI family thioesterase [Rhodocista pekingensis]|uniref:PaaI family thioesterase n=1 Tax=Rhodocista pekingensis TaxID=201185 RepID=A0ABW2L2H7_9PROT
MASEIGSPLDDRVVRRVQDSFARQGLMAHLGATLHEVRAGLVVVRLPFRPELTQQHGYFHAGATGAIADTAGGFAAFTLFPEDSAVLSVEYKINLLNPGRGEFLEAVGRVVKSGRTLTVCQLEVNAHQGDSVSPVAVGQQTLICLRGRPD